MTTPADQEPPHRRRRNQTKKGDHARGDQPAVPDALADRAGSGWEACPDNGDWTIPTGGGPDRHNCGNIWVYADGHAKWAKLVSTLTPWDAWNDKEGPNPYLKDLARHNKVTGCP